MNICVVGLQWGDEGKGKVVDLLGGSADFVVRYSGGANAGHTVIRNDTEDPFALHLLPSGVLREGVVSVIANGVVVDADTLLGEIERLEERQIIVDQNLKISGRAHLVMDYHKKQDQLSETALGPAKLGTTIRGIGPCYADKVTRTTALRVADLLDVDRMYERLERIVDQKNRYFTVLYGDQQPLQVDEIFAKCRRWAQKLKPFITDTTALLHAAWAQGKNILFEGAQGTLLDLDHGTFPFVTSSNSSAGGLSSMSGLPARAVDSFLGVAKAYSTRVGAGPFPTEQDNEIGDYIRTRGHEYGTTTGRPRRCGWFDAVSVGYSLRIGGIDQVTLQHLDTLCGLKRLKVCTAYYDGGGKLDFFPAERAILERIECEYETLDGFDEDIGKVRDFNRLPAPAQNYVKRLEEILRVPITMIGVGPSREQMILRRN
ncbi:MAG: hypothetical protein AMJ79_04490 [Phycisphaerae bacterium SM23_30]|nr:MAG: hypothetical protein AMJ79_04490 [Phycisphaerae bacterium SM23_30]